jgi:catechol 2,3-dioxygenase-like lactoylglutathione lyase family enzyme
MVNKMNMELKQTITPVLRILDVAKAKEFYIDWLGFSIDWEHRFGENFPLYCQISKHGIIIHLTEHYGDCIPGSRIRILIKELETFHSQLTLKDYRYYKPGIEQMEWGTREMTLIDPFGNHVIFVEDLK